MNPYDLLKSLKRAGVEVSILGDRLSFTPASRLTDRDKAEIVRSKPQLIALLGRPALGSHARPFRVFGWMPDVCFFNEVCDGAMLRKSNLSCCSKCGAWFCEENQ